jgi:transformation/transcription domain-associated protein
MLCRLFSFVYRIAPIDTWQALFFHLRTTREEMGIAKRQAQLQARLRESQAAAQAKGGDIVMQDATAAGTQSKPTPVANAPHGQDGSSQRGQGEQGQTGRFAWEHIDEVVQILKTAFPLLILSMETMVDQIMQRFKGSPEEEAYRLLGMLLQDAMQVGCSIHT